MGLGEEYISPYGLIIGANFPLQQFWNCSGMCRTGQALFNHESHTYTLMTPERGHIREHAISCKGHWSRDCCSLHVQCFILGSITAGGGKGSCFWTIKGFQRQLLSCGGIHTPSCAVSELHVSSFTFCTLSSERLLPFWFLLFNLHLSYRIRERTRLCVQLHLQRKLSPSASVIQPLLFKPARGETRAYAVSHSLYVGSDCNGFQQYRQGLLI